MDIYLFAVIAAWLLCVVVIWRLFNKLSARWELWPKAIAKAFSMAFAFAPSLIVGNQVGVAAPAPASLVLALVGWDSVILHSTSDSTMMLTYSIWSLFLTWFLAASVSILAKTIIELRKRG